MNVDFTLTGLSPLLMHADDVLMADELSHARKTMPKGQKAAGDDRSPAWSWHTYCYHEGDELVWPSENLMVSLRSAAATVIYSKMKSFKELSQSGLVIPTEALGFATRKGPVSWPMIQAWRDNDTPFMEQSKLFTKADPDCTLFVKRAKVGTAKHVRVRPRFENWTVSGRIIITNSEITYERLCEFFEIAGDRVGLGDWRPSSKTPGPYGRFKAELRKAK